MTQTLNPVLNGREQEKGKNELGKKLKSETLNPFLNAQKQVKNACDKLKLEPSVYELLK